MTPDRVAESKALAREFMATYAATPGGMYYRVGMLLAEAAAELERIQVLRDTPILPTRKYGADGRAVTASDPAARAYPVPIGAMQPPGTEGQK